MPIHRLVLLTLAVATALTAQYHYYVPEMVDGNAVAHHEHSRARTRFLNIRTTFVLVNTGKTDANVTITATRDDATARHLNIPGLGSGTSLSTKLAPGATRLFVTDGGGDGNAGAAVVSSDSPLNVSEILSNTNSGNPVSESAIPALGAEELATEYMIPVDTSAGLETAIALYNPGADSATVTVRLLDRTGTAVKTATLTLGAQQRTTLFATDALLEAGSGFRGTMDVSSDVRLAAVAVRRSASSPAYTLLPAASQVSRDLQFLLPGIADGRAASTTTQTTFLLTNLSATSASVTLTLTRDNGTPLKVNIAGVGSNDVFHSTIAPGASLFLETDGASATLTSGAAAIKSDQPLAVSAVVSASDSIGFVTETSLTPAPLFFQWVLPFDNTGKTVAAARFYNAGSKPVTLTLRLNDTEGKPLANKELPPLAAGTAMTATVAELFAGVPANKGAITVSSPSPVELLVSVLALRQSSQGAVLSIAPAVTLLGTGSGTPASVAPTLDMADQATATISSTGGSLSATDAKGNRFTLTIPSGALLDRATITMTPISSATGLSGPGLVAGVQLEPDGLVLFQPALLKIDLAAAAPDAALPIGWRGQAPGVYVNTVLPDTKSLTLALSHFSGAGVGGIDLTGELLVVDNLIDFVGSVVADLVAERRQLQLLGMDAAEARVSEDIQTLVAYSYQLIIVPFMKLAESSDDPDVISCAQLQVHVYERIRQLSGIATGENDPISQEIHEFVFVRAPALLFQKLSDRCKRHDFSVFYQLLAAIRTSGLLGADVPDLPTLTDTVQSCQPKLQLDYNSEEVVTVPAGDLKLQFDSTIKGTLVAQGLFSQDVLNNVTDLSKDLFTSFKLSGAGKELYPIPGFVFPQGDCNTFISMTTPGTMTIEPAIPNVGEPLISQIQFQFDPHYQPQAVDLKGQQLCSFCPVYQKKPVKVELILYPGLPMETVQQNCSDGSQQTLPFYAWSAGWGSFHVDDEGFFPDWELVNQPDLFAQKSISRSVISLGLPVTENTDLKLKACTGQTMTDSNGQQTCTQNGAGGASSGASPKR